MRDPEESSVEENGGRDFASNGLTRVEAGHAFPMRVTLDELVCKSV
jgi:hypothetical protein